MYWIRSHRFKNTAKSTLSPMTEKPDGINISKKEAIAFTYCIIVSKLKKVCVLKNDPNY